MPMIASTECLRDACQAAVGAPPLRFHAVQELSKSYVAHALPHD
jgi:hypothetical protein